VSQPPSHAHALAAQHLAGPRVSHGSRIRPDRYNLALASLGAGLDHLGGEVAVALSEGLVHSEKLSHVALFTDRRLLARTGEISGFIPYPGITEARPSSGVLVDELSITAHGRIFTFRNLPEGQPTSAFLQALLRIHPGYRAPPVGSSGPGLTSGRGGGAR